MSFLHSLTHSFEEVALPPCEGRGRPSNMTNEDDYDYAIELRPEEEYREVAAKGSQFIDFAELDLTKIREAEEEDREDDNKSVSTFDSGVSPTHSTRQECDPDDLIDKKSFLHSMYNMSQRKRWVETVSRRSSQLYLKERTASHEEIKKNFLSALASGVSVRRHQTNKFAETVTLFGDWTKSKNSHDGKVTEENSLDLLVKILWEPEESFRLRKYLRADGDAGDDQTEVLNAEDNEIGEWTLDRCARLCGFGDNLFGGVREDPPEHLGRTSISQTNMRLDRNSKHNHESVETNQLFNHGFKRKGSLLVADIIAVQPAHQLDPIQLGETATANFRGSLDQFNPHLSFAVVIYSFFSYHGIQTLDIECDDEETYLTLLSGFLLLVKSTLAARHQQRDELERQKSEVIKRVASGFEKVMVNSPRRMLSTMKSNLFASAGLQIDQDQDPIERMFFPDLENGDGKSPIPLFREFTNNKSMTPPAQFLGWSTKGTQIWARLRMAGLEVKPVFSWDLKGVILKIRCPNWRLEEVAEKMHIRLRLRNGGFKRFKISQRDHFAAAYDGTIFRSSERQQVIDFILRSKIKDGGAELDERTRLGDSIVQRFPLHMRTRLEELKNSWVFFWRAEQPGEIPQPWSPFSAPLSVTCNRVYLSICYFANGMLNQPLDQIAEYYGESIAFYFAWVAFFTRWLILPSILGLIVFAIQISSKQLDHWICIPYGVFVVIWCSLMLVFWRQKQSALAYRWGVLGFEMEETERPQFRGKSVYDPSTQEMRKVYSPEKRLGKYMIAVPCMLFLTGVMMFVMMVVLSSQEKLSKEYSEGKELGYLPTLDFFSENPTSFYNGNTTSTQGPNLALGKLFTLDASYWMAMMYFPSMYGLIVSIVSEFVDYAALKLTDFENHRKESTYWSRLILKIFCFRFVAVFTPVYYYAFFVNNHEEAYVKMFMCILALVTVGDWWKKFLSTCLPAWIHRFQLYRLTLSLSQTNRLIWEAKWAMTESKEENRFNEFNKLISRREQYHKDAQSSTWSEALLQDFTGIEDYTQVILQLGFVLLFGIVFPLGPIIALLNNLFFIRIDAAKLMFTRKRPIAKKIGGLGVWEDVLQIMSVIGILTNCCLMLFTSNKLKHSLAFLGVGGVAILLFAYEHIVLFFKYFLHSSINRVPASVQRDQERNRILSQKRRVEKADRFRRYEDDQLGGDQKKKRMSIRSEPCLQGDMLTSLPSFLSLKKGQSNHSEEKSKRKTPLSRSETVQSSVLAADPFDFYSGSDVESPAPYLCPINRIGDITLKTPQELLMSQSLSPLMEILHFSSSRSDTKPESPAQLTDSSSSSDSELEIYSQKSNGKYSCSKSLNHYGGPGPAICSSPHLLKQENLVSKSAKDFPQSRRESLQSESATSYYDENEEDCWKIQSLTQIAALSTVRKPLGPERIQCAEHPNNLHRCNTFESSISSLTGPSTWNDHDEPTQAGQSSAGRASLLQVPGGDSAPKPIREPRKPSLGIQSISPSLRRPGPNSTPPNSYKRSPNIITDLFPSFTPQSTPPVSVSPKKMGSDSKSPLELESKLKSPETPVICSPSAPLPPKPLRTPQDSSAGVPFPLSLHSLSPAVDLPSHLDQLKPVQASLNSLPSKPEAVKFRRPPQRPSVLVDIPLISPLVSSPKRNSPEPSSIIPRATSPLIAMKLSPTLALVDHSPPPSPPRYRSVISSSPPSPSRSPSPVREIIPSSVINDENNSQIGNSPERMANHSQPDPLPNTNTGKTQTLSSSSSTRTKYLSKRSEEIQIEQTKQLTPKKKDLGKAKPKMTPTVSSPNPKTPSKRTAPPSHTQTPTPTKLKSAVVTSPLPPLPVQSPAIAIKARPTFQQRMESWLHHADHPEDSLNPFLGVLKDE